MSGCLGWLEKVNRKKKLDDDVLETPLKRCLNTIDLTLLGIGHMVGAGIFVLTGTVVRELAGPGAVLSYVFAGIAATLASLCYAEFGAQVPKAGSAYTYSYVTMGEIWAFMIGWNIILEHMLGVASVAKAWSGSFDALFNGAIKNGTMEHIGTINVYWLSDYPDFIALLVCIIVMIFIVSGAKISVNFNSVFTVINMIVIIIIISVGFSLSESKNWTNSDNGGFLPYGFQGVFAGAATCFYAYIGFEGIAVAGEEAKNPEKSLPRATGLAMLIVTLLYVGSSAALTLMVPFNIVDIAAPFPTAFEERGMHWVKNFVAVGCLFGITTSITGAMFTLPRAVYAMAADGVFFRVFSKVHPKTQTPILAVVVFGGSASILALLLDLSTLVEFLSIGTLLSFTIVAASVIILRYQPAETCQMKLKPEEGSNVEEDEEEHQFASDKKNILKTSQSHDDIGKLKEKFIKLPFIKDLSPGNATVGAVIVLAILLVAFSAMLLHATEYVLKAAWWSVILLILIIAGIIMCFLVLLAHEQNRSFRTFQVSFTLEL